MDTRIVEVGEWLPDQPALNNLGATEALNVLADVRGYRPMPSLRPLSAAVADPCLGAAAFKDINGVAAVFVGTADALYQDDTGGTWDDVSDTGGYTVTNGEFWTFTLFGTTVVAAEIDEPPQAFNLGTSTAFAALSATAPQARYCGVIKESLFLGNINDIANTADGVVPNRVHWSGFNEPDAWPAAGSSTAIEKQSDFQDIPNGGAVRGITGAINGADGAVFMESAIYRVQYEGPPTFYGFYEVEHSKGCVASRSIVNTGNAAFYLAEDGFYAFNGSTCIPISAEKVARWFYDDVDAARIDQITGAYDRLNQCVRWSYPSTSCPSTVAADSMIIYNITLQKWTRAEINASCLLSFYSPGMDLDDLDTIYPAGLDSIPMSLDSRAFSAGRQELGAIDSDYKLAAFDGANLAAIVETGEINGDGAGRKVYLSGVRPLLDGTSVSTTVAVSSRDRLDAAIVWGDAVAQCETGIAPQRVKARYMRVRVNVPASSAWICMPGVEIRLQQEGDR